jgi:hypothetical protein
MEPEISIINERTGHVQNQDIRSKQLIRVVRNWYSCPRILAFKFHGYATISMEY